MLTPVFWLKSSSRPVGEDGGITPEHPGLVGLDGAEWLSALAEVKPLESWDALAEALASQELKHPGGPSVVVFSESASAVSLSLGKLRLISPATSFLVSLCGEDDLDNSLFVLDCDYILPQTSAFEVQHRLQMALKWSESRATLSTSAQMDEVTTLFNRRYFMDRLNSEISLAKRHLSPLSVVVIRISFFQVYVDSYGYEFILDLLCHVAGLVRQQLRQEDIVARLGDDEIALLLPRSSEEGAKILTERIMEKIVSEPYYPFGKTEEDGEEISAYAGIVSYPLPDEDVNDADSLLRYARHAVHQARCSSEGLVLLFSEIEPVL